MDTFVYVLRYIYIIDCINGRVHLHIFKSKLCVFFICFACVCALFWGWCVGPPPALLWCVIWVGPDPERACLLCCPGDRRERALDGRHVHDDDEDSSSFAVICRVCLCVSLFLSVCVPC